MMPGKGQVEVGSAVRSDSVNKDFHVLELSHVW